MLGRAAFGPYLVLVLLGCGPQAMSGHDATTDVGAASDTSSTGTENETATFGLLTSSDATGNTQSTTADDTASTSSDGDTTGEPPLTCPPQRSAYASFAVLPYEPLDAVCIVGEPGPGPGGSLLVPIDCDGVPREIHLRGPTPLLSAGMAVRVEYLLAPTLPAESRWLAISTATGESDRLLVGGVDSYTLDPPGTTLDAWFDTGAGEPLVGLLEGLCPAQPTTCGSIARRGVEVSMLDGQSVSVFDETQGSVASASVGYEVVVAEAVDELVRSPTCAYDSYARVDLTMTMFTVD